jgi:hypothetical protein
MKTSLIALATAFLCCQEEPKLREGVYAMCEEVTGYSGETIELKDGKFRYWFYSDVVAGDEPHYPLSGSYSVKGNTLTLDLDKIHSKERTIAVVNGVNVLWRKDGLALWEKEKRLHPYAVLILMAGKTDGSKVDERPSIKVLYTQEMIDREKKEHEERFNDKPAEVRVLLRARTPKGDSNLDAYRKEIAKARAQPDPKLLAQLVGLLDRDSKEAIEARMILEDICTETWLLKEIPAFLKNEETRKKGLEALIDALGSASDRTALEHGIMVFLRASQVGRIDLDIPEAAVRVKLAFTKEGAQSFDSRGPDVNWRSVLSKVIPACQKWMRGQLAK